MSGTRADARKARELSEAEVHAVAWCRERRREVVQQALAAVWSGADFVDADCVLDQLEDRGARVVVGPDE